MSQFLLKHLLHLLGELVEMFASFLLLLGQIFSLLLQSFRHAFQSCDLASDIFMDLIPFFTFNIGFIFPVSYLTLHLLEFHFLVFLHLDQLGLRVIHAFQVAELLAMGFQLSILCVYFCAVFTRKFICFSHTVQN